MRSNVILASLAMLTATLANGCAVARSLYDAVVHNSGAPSRADRARLDARQAELLRGLPDSRVAILPVAVLGRDQRADSAAATTIANQLRRSGSVAAATTGAECRLPFSPQPNQSAIFWSRFKALARHVEAHPSRDADYVLLVDVFGDPKEGHIGAVHVMGVTGNGEMAYRGAWNSYHPLYKEFKPRSLDDVAMMVATDLQRRASVIPR